MSDLPVPQKDEYNHPENESALNEHLARLFGYIPLEIPPPRIRLSIDATTCAPVLAAMIAQMLTDAGATVTAGNGVMATKIDPKVNLKGLYVHIGQLTWVREEEADRWGAT